MASPLEAAASDKPPRSTAKNFRSILIGRLFSALSIWLALVALTKMTDPATVGLYALAQAICIPIAEVSKMSLREIRSADTESEFLFGDYMGMRLLATLVGFVLMVFAGLVQSETAAMLAVIVLYGLARCCELISDMIYGLFQAHERMEYIGWSLCILGPTSLAMLVTGYWLTGSLVVAVAGQLLAHIAVLSLYDIPLGRVRASARGDTFQPRWRFSALSSLVRRAVPLTFATVLIIIALYFPRVTVEYELGLTGLGLFAAIFALAMAPDRLVNALGIATETCDTLVSDRSNKMWRDARLPR
ncbi:MAG: oligosaccharide flippase family protein, partial [Pseudomonadota bacterium]